MGSNEGNGDEPIAAPKVHPATREMLPDDPLALHGVQLAGDPGLMLQLLVEEYARIGWGAAEIKRLALDPHYQAFHGLRRLYGDEALCRRIDAIVGRCGVLRVKAVEAPQRCEHLVQLEALN
ncbi:MAG: hypothetical protein DCC67_03240 [Planctomycetota bacterium]|nr:MAG: hypothetical protein DCC67_03240 [Planctomycetota bacterium]